jgi:hypothetical protein
MLFIALALHPFVAAADGVVEINQACAALTGRFAGDAPGYPATIDGSPGRNDRLPSDLGVPSFTDGVLVSANSVHLDLGGFAIIPDGCSAPELDGCAAARGSGTGVRTFSGPSVHISNGSILGMNDACSG